MEDEQRIQELIQEMKTEASSIRGDEFGIFDYNDEDRETQESKWRILSYIIEMNRMSLEDTAILFQNNPFFFDWYKRNVISEVPIEETYH
jgi:hypothetical protein|tara:strand:+ start:297 stop:566 length:270 start_codon:yes stop_codon:yes gene_type:complete